MLLDDDGAGPLTPVSFSMLMLGTQGQQFTLAGAARAAGSRGLRGYRGEEHLRVLLGGGGEEGIALRRGAANLSTASFAARRDALLRPHPQIEKDYSEGTPLGLPAQGLRPLRTPAWRYSRLSIVSEAGEALAGRTRFNRRLHGFARDSFLG